ncbi:reverse transcriptase-like protein, partial [Aeromonas jandaei]|uniref:reverse transcriptase-like protein n=1 Tax=Aeromonas jandaei TaxID=650 RepID=UPI0038B42C30
AEDGERIGEMTNNRAEYEALIRGLEVARDYGFEEIEIRGDSQLVVKQVRGEWDANDPGMKERRVRVHELLSAVSDWAITHVPRELNERA